MRRSREVLTGLMVRYYRYGDAVEEFCRRQGISTASFCRWRGRLGNSLGAIRETPADDEPKLFLDLGTIHRKNSAPSAKPGFDLRPDLGDGLLLVLVRHGCFSPKDWFECMCMTLR